MGEFLLSFDGKKIETSHKNCWFLRGQSMDTLVRGAFSLLTDAEISAMKPFVRVFHLNDHGDGEYTICSDRYTDRTLPCYIFDHWKEAKIDDYSEMCDLIKQRSLSPWKIDKLFWAGQISHPTRRIFLERFGNHHKIEAVGHRDHWGHGQRTPVRYLSLPDHCDYRYMLDLQGSGYSGRTKLLFHTNRVLFYQERRFHEYWYWSVKPFVHYIPIKEDLSDFGDKFAWAESHPKECAEIARNAYEFASSNLRRQDALLRLKKILIDIGLEGSEKLYRFWSVRGGESNDLGMLQLMPGGRVRLNSHPNESFWSSEENSISLYNSEMKPTCVLTDLGNGEYSGVFLMDGEVTHKMSQIKV